MQGILVYNFQLKSFDVILYQGVQLNKVSLTKFNVISVAKCQKHADMIATCDHESKYVVASKEFRFFDTCSTFIQRNLSLLLTNEIMLHKILLCRPLVLASLFHEGGLHIMILA